MLSELSSSFYIVYNSTDCHICQYFCKRKDRATARNARSILSVVFAFTGSTPQLTRETYVHHYDQLHERSLSSVMVCEVEFLGGVLC